VDVRLPGVEDTRGFLDLSQVDAGNANFQYYDQIWIQRAMTGEGKRGAPTTGNDVLLPEGLLDPVRGHVGRALPPQDVLHVQHRDGAAVPERHSHAGGDAYTDAYTGSHTGSYAHRSPDARTDSHRDPDSRTVAGRECPAVPLVRARVAVWPKGQGVPQPPVTSGAAAS